MDDSRRLDPTAALCRLQAFTGREVRVTANLHGHFYGTAMHRHLERVETLAPDHVAVCLIFGDGEGLFIDLGEAEISAGKEAGGYLEFRVGLELCVLVESHSQRASRSPRDQVGV